MHADLVAAVRDRAHERCEYCQLPQSVRRLRFQIEHVIPKQHRGDDGLGNLALACGRCNRRKGPNIAGIDPETGQMSRLFNPRSDRWAKHFAWRGPLAVGLTPVGRATIEVLQVNQADEIAIRLELIESRKFPPT